MSDSHDRDLERRAADARKKLAETEQRADETIEDAASHLHELAEEQEERADRLRRESRNPTGPVSPAPNEKDEEAGGPNQEADRS